MSATETKFWYLRYLLNNKVSTLLRNTAIIFFAYGKRKQLFSAVRSWLVNPARTGGHLGAAKTA